MRSIHTLPTLLLSVLSLSCHAAETREPDSGADHMASFACMLPGEWQVTFQSGTSMYHTWSWGPGEHSITRVTDGSGAGGEPWRSLHVYYWHPGLEEIRSLGLSPYARGVGEGPMTFDGTSGHAELTLHQTPGPRTMATRWTFDGPDAYVDELLEDTGSGYETLVALKLERSNTIAERVVHGIEHAPEPTMFLQALTPMIDEVWTTSIDSRSTTIETTVEWIPHADYVHVQSHAVTMQGDRSLVLDAYAYHHTGTGRLRGLALTADGGVHEGTWTVLEDGRVEFDATSYLGDAVASRTIQLGVNEDGVLRQQVWSIEDAQRILERDSRHTPRRR